MAGSARSKFAVEKTRSRPGNRIFHWTALCQHTQLTASKFGTVYKAMAEAKKGVARIPVPPRKRPQTEDSAKEEAGQGGQNLGENELRGVHMLMSEPVPAKRDPLTVPLIGLLLAFSVISLIVQMLIAFS